LGLVSRKVTILIFASNLSKLTPLPFARYRYTATLVTLILQGGYQSPHRTIDEYVKMYTGFRPTDGEIWADRELPLPVGFMDTSVTKLNFEKMGESSRFL